MPLRVVCFTCGNAAEALREAGLDVVEVGPRGMLRPSVWWEASDIARAWPGHFDATSGHLPGYLMRDLAVCFTTHLSRNDEFLDARQVEVPTGSGETLVALSWAWPEKQYVAAYDNERPETTYSPGAPLNGLVRRLAHRVVGGPDGND